MNKKLPKISVVLPALNEARYLPAALRSLAAQSYRDFEVIVADNNSTDATAKVALEFGARVVHELKPGVCAARQAGTAAARGEIVVSTDADTRFEPDWLASIAAEFEDPEVVLVAGPPRFFDAPLWGRLYPRVLFGIVRAVRAVTGRMIYASACNLAFRREAWEGYNTDLTQGGDEFYLLRQLAGKGRVVYLATNPVYTSGRRLKKGFLYNFVVTFLTFYIGDYFLSKFSRKSVFGSFPAVRDARSMRPGFFWRTVSFMLLAGLLLYANTAHPGLARAIQERVPSVHAPHVHIDLDLPHR